MLFFAIDSVYSFQTLKEWADLVIEAKYVLNWTAWVRISRYSWDDRSYPSLLQVLVGTKADCSQERMVSEEDARKLAESIGADYFEISCQTGTLEQALEPISCLVKKIHAAKLEAPVRPAGRNYSTDCALM